MLQQDLDTHEDQDDTTGDFCLCFVAQTENIANFHTDHGEDQSGHADEKYCGNDVNLQEGKSDTYSQGINDR